jgi:Ca-activated chloride channel family protein
MTFYDQFSGKIKYNLIHTMNNRGEPDTLILDHLLVYRLKINTLPLIEIDSVRIIPGIHTIIPVNAPQGYLTVKTTGDKSYTNISFVVRKHGEMNTLNMQSIEEVEKYLIGHYDLEIPTIPRLNIDNVEIRQSHTTSIELPLPGTAVFSGQVNGYGSLYKISGDEQEWIYNLQPALRKQSIYMQPGNYRAIFRPATSKSSLYTLVKDFSVKGGEEVLVELR